MTSHILELKIRILYVLISFCVTFCICYYFQVEFFFLVIKPLFQKNYFFFVYTDITEAFITFWYISLFFSFFFLTPFLLYQSWCFCLPGLYTFEMRFFRNFLYCGLVLFLSGIFVGYFYVVPIIWSFLLNYVQFNIQFLAKISNYTIFFLSFLLFFGLLFELPLLLFFIVKLQLITTKFLVRKRFWFYFGLLLFAAFITPPDLNIQFFIYLFLVFIYEFSLFLFFYYDTLLKTSSS